MEIAAFLVTILILVLFVFALLLLVFAIGRYLAHLVLENENQNSQVVKLATTFKFVVFTDISGSLSYFKVLIASCVITLFIIVGLAFTKLTGV